MSGGRPDKKRTNTEPKNMPGLKVIGLENSVDRLSFSFYLALKL